MINVAWPPDGLVPVAIVDARTGELLTLAYANDEALQKTLATRETHLWSRSRKALWRKGETSGNTQRVVEVRVDCDGDALEYRVVPRGPACHTGAATCFESVLLGSDGSVPSFARTLERLQATIAVRRTADPQTSYVATLLSAGIDRIAKKVGEEATEVVIAAKNADRSEIAWEVADLLFHLLVLLEDRNVSLDEIAVELQRREK